MTTVTARSPRRDAADNRAALLEAARRVLNQNADAPLEVIAAEAGLSRRSVYGHFANRDELLLELLTVGARRVVDALEGVTHPEPVVRLALIAGHLWREVEDVRVMALFSVRGPFKVHTAEVLRPLRGRVLEAVREGQASGSVRTDIPPDRLARLVEQAALAVLGESAEHPLGEREGHDLAVRVILSTIGLNWREAQAFLTSHPELDGRDAKS